MFESDLDALPTRDLLERAAGCRATANRSDAELLECAQLYADRHHPSACHPRPGRRNTDGREQAVVLGGDGCPEIAEFALAEFAVVVGVSPGVGRDLIADALALRHRFPHTWAQIQRGQATPWKARQIVRACTKLDQPGAAYVDHRIAGIIDTISPYRLDKIIQAAKITADPATARKEATEDAAERGVFVGRTKHGNKTIYIKAPAAAVNRFDTAITAIADALKTFGDTRNLQHRRADAIAILPDPHYTQELLTQAHTHTQRAHHHPTRPPTAPDTDASTASGADASTGLSGSPATPPGTGASTRPTTAPDATSGTGSGPTTAPGTGVGTGPAAAPGADATAGAGSVPTTAPGAGVGTGPDADASVGAATRPVAGRCMDQGPGSESEAAGGGGTSRRPQYAATSDTTGITSSPDVTGGRDVTSSPDFTGCRDVTGSPDFTGRRDVSGSLDFTDGDITGSPDPTGNPDFTGSLGVTGARNLTSVPYLCGALDPADLVEPPGPLDDPWLEACGPIDPEPERDPFDSHTAPHTPPYIPAPPSEPDQGSPMDAAALRALDARLAQIKHDAYTRPGGPAGRSKSQLRPGQTDVVVHLTDHTLANGTGVLRAETIGPLLASQLTELIGHGPYTVKPVIDLNDAVSVNAYEIPPRIRERVKLMYPVELFPYGTRETSNTIDLDHIEPYDPSGPPGQTSTTNLAPLSRFGHRVKTHAQGWSVRRIDDKTLEWTTPHGFTFHVDPNGTHRISRADASDDEPGTGTGLAS